MSQDDRSIKRRRVGGVSQTGDQSANQAGLAKRKVVVQLATSLFLDVMEDGSITEEECLLTRKAISVLAQMYAGKEEDFKMEPDVGFSILKDKDLAPHARDMLEKVSEEVSEALKKSTESSIPRHGLKYFDIRAGIVNAEQLAECCDVSKAELLKGDVPREVNDWKALLLAVWAKSRNLLVDSTLKFIPDQFMLKERVIDCLMLKVSIQNSLSQNIVFFFVIGCYMPVMTILKYTTMAMRLRVVVRTVSKLPLFNQLTHPLFLVLNLLFGWDQNHAILGFEAKAGLGHFSSMTQLPVDIAAGLVHYLAVFGWSAWTYLFGFDVCLFLPWLQNIFTLATFIERTFFEVLVTLVLAHFIDMLLESVERVANPLLLASSLKLGVKSHK